MIDAGATAWLLVSTALVMLMTPGLALFYGGMVQRKNVLSTFMHSFFALAIVSLQWVLIGYSMAFGSSHGGLIGGFDFVGLSGVGVEAAPGKVVPHLLFMAYQGMFAIITPALISGAFAERLKFSAYCLFTLLWSVLVYNPLAHWVWNADGWLAKLGALDFAGGTVVHLSSGVSALVVAIVLGKRLGYPKSHQPHNLTMTVLGAGILWFGWFGFNAGSAMTDDGRTSMQLASVALVNTHIAAAAGAFFWALVEMLRIGKATMLGVASGLVAGLVAITPAAGYVSPMSAIIIGAAAGMVCYGGVLLKSKIKVDDALDAFGVHGIGGALGAVLTGVFATTTLTPTGGLIAGNAKLFLANLAGIGAAGLYAAVMSFGIIKLVDKVVGLRPTAEEEYDGLDGTLHGESAYHLGSSVGTTNAPVVERSEEEPSGSPEVARAVTVQP
jgi:ammonium transporter, Amt family